MSRSGYSDNLDNWDLIRWRGAVNSAIRGRRGQALLREMADALDAMPQKVLVRDELVTQGGEVCALGSVAVKRGIDTSGIDPYCRETVADVFGIAPALAAEIMFVNDDFWRRETAAERWLRVRSWVAQQILPAPSSETSAFDSLAPLEERE